MIKERERASSQRKNKHNNNKFAVFYLLTQLNDRTGVTKIDYYTMANNNGRQGGGGGGGSNSNMNEHVEFTVKVSKYNTVQIACILYSIVHYLKNIYERFYQYCNHRN